MRMGPSIIRQTEHFRHWRIARRTLHLNDPVSTECPSITKYLSYVFLCAESIRVGIPKFARTCARIALAQVRFIKYGGIAWASRNVDLGIGTRDRDKTASCRFFWFVRMVRRQQRTHLLFSGVFRQHRLITAGTHAEHVPARTLITACPPHIQG